MRNKQEEAPDSGLIMSDSEYNPHDPLFLLSRSIDGDLTPAEQEQLEAALAASAELRAEAEQLRTVCRLIQAWGARAPGVDAEDLGDEVTAHLAESAEDAELAGVDQLLQRWSRPAPEVDWERFQGAVMARIAPEPRAAPLRGRLIRLGTPLAAAAAIALAFIGYLRPWETSPPEQMSVPTVLVQVGPQVETLATGMREDVFQVSFGRDSVAQTSTKEVRRGPSCVIAGAGLRPASYGVQPPL